MLKRPRRTAGTGALLLPLCVISALPLLADEGDSVTVGVRVRVTSPAGQTIGAVKSAIAEDGLTVEVEGEDHVIPIESISRLEMSTGLRRRTGRGALIGALVGAAAGAVGGATGPCPDIGGSIFETEPRDPCGAEGALFGAAALGLVGAGVGALLGTFVLTDKWEPIPLESLSIQPDGVSLSLRFPPPRRE